MRRALVVCLLVAHGVAGAEPSRLPFDTIRKGKTGDWTLLEGKRRDGAATVTDRVIAKLVVDKTTVRIAWFRGPKNAETFWQVISIPGAASFDTRIVGHPAAVVRDFKIMKGQCMYISTDVHFCSKVAYKTANDETVELIMSSEVRGVGLVRIAITDAKGDVWRVTVTGYGNGTKSVWGRPASTAKLEIPPS